MTFITGIILVVYASLGFLYAHTGDYLSDVLSNITSSALIAFFAWHLVSIPLDFYFFWLGTRKNVSDYSDDTWAQFITYGSLINSIVQVIPITILTLAGIVYVTFTMVLDSSPLFGLVINTGLAYFLIETYALLAAQIMHATMIYDDYAV